MFHWNQSSSHLVQRTAFRKSKRAVFVYDNGLWGHLCKRQLWFRKDGSLRRSNWHRWLPARETASLSSTTLSARTYQSTACRVVSYRQDRKQSQSPWSSPVVLPRKHDSTYCMCTEYCKLSQLTKEDFMPLPQMDDVWGILARVQESCGPRFGLRLLANTSEIREQA